MISTLTHKPSAKSESGFTLIEVMIAIVLLVMISVAIYQATTQTFRYRAKIISEGDFYGGIRLSMGLMDRDIAAMYSPTMVNPNRGKQTTGDSTTDDPNSGRTSRGRTARTANPDAEAHAAKLDEILRSDLGKPNDYWLAATDITGIRLSRFTGSESKIQFVTSSHQRVYKNTPETEFAKVTYEVRTDPDTGALPGTKLLVRTEDATVFNDDAKNKTEKAYPLLPGVKSFKFRFFRRDKRAWETTWDNNREDMKGLYPDLVELAIEVEGSNRLSFKGTYMFKPETYFYGMDPSL